MVLYVVGDIHGRADCLRQAQAAIDQDRAVHAGGCRVLEIYVGDYVDRGPDSKGVLDLMLERSDATEIVALKGNHEMLMESFLQGELTFDDWRRCGGLETVASYGAEARALLKKGRLDASSFASMVPLAHLQFLAALKTCFVAGAYCFVHAGIRPGVALKSQTAQDIAWIREDFLNFEGNLGHIVVHGHSAAPEIEFRNNRINVDTGAYISNRLSVLRIDAHGVAIVDGRAK